MYHQASGIVSLFIALVVTPAMWLCLRDPGMVFAARSTSTASVPVSASA